MADEDEIQAFLLTPLVRYLQRVKNKKDFTDAVGNASIFKLGGNAPYYITGTGSC
jgi:hypothetical protein